MGRKSGDKSRDKEEGVNIPPGGDQENLPEEPVFPYQYLSQNQKKNDSS
jgi:hypothetical protein